MAGFVGEDDHQEAPPAQHGGLSRHVGPLPLWGWIVAGAGAALVLWTLYKRGQSNAQGGGQAAVVPGDLSGGVPSNSDALNQSVDTLNSLLQQVVASPGGLAGQPGQIGPSGGSGGGGGNAVIAPGGAAAYGQPTGLGVIGDIVRSFSGGQSVSVGQYVQGQGGYWYPILDATGNIEGYVPANEIQFPGQGGPATASTTQPPSTPGPVTSSGGRLPLAIAPYGPR